MQNNPITISPTLSGRLNPSATLLINEKVNQMWAAGQTVYHLGFGESRMPVHPKIEEALRENAHRKSYLAGQGLSELREAVAGFYGREMDITVDPSQIIIAPGSKILLFALQMALGADLILPTPSWVSYAPQAHLLQRSVHTISASIDTQYELTIDALDRTIAGVNAPKVLLLNSPNNPTGRMLSEAQLRELADYCRTKQIMVLSDEIYGMVAHGAQPHRSIQQFYPEGTVVLGGLSKHLSLGGWRLGVAILPDTPAGKTLMQAVRVIASETWSSASSPIQYAAITAYSDDRDIVEYIDECTEIHRSRTRHLWSWLSELGINCTEPQGGFYMVANFDRWREPLVKQGIDSSEQLATHLLETYQIATLPGTAFGIPAHELSLRLSTSYLDMETDVDAARLVAAYRSGVDEETFTRDHLPMMNGAVRQFGRFVTAL